MWLASLLLVEPDAFHYGFHKYIKQLNGTIKNQQSVFMGLLLLLLS